MRRAARVDNNHAEIVQAFKDCGYEVLSLASLGQGVPDLLVCYSSPEWSGPVELVEVKNGAKPPSKRRLTEDQKGFHDRWPVSVVTSASDVYRDWA